MFYSSLENETTKRAFAVMDELENWREESGRPEELVPNVTVSFGALEVSMGDVCVWCSEVDSTDDLTRDYCIASLKDQMDRVARLLN